MEQHLGVAHRDDVVVEDALVHHRRILLGEHHALLAQPVQPGDGLGGFQSLASWIAMGLGIARIEGATAKDEELHARGAVVVAEAGVVGCALVAELGHRGQRRMVLEMRGIAKHRLEDARRGGRFEAAVKFAGQVGRGEMHPAIMGVGARADGGGVGGPHGRGGAGGQQQRQGFARGAFQHLGITAGEAQAAQGGDVGPLVGREDPLLEAQLHQRLHLGQALTCRLARIRTLLLAGLGGHVAIGQARIVVGRTDQAVEIDLPSSESEVTHRCNPGGNWAGRLRASLSSEATGKAQ